MAGDIEDDKIDKKQRKRKGSNDVEPN